MIIMNNIHALARLAIRICVVAAMAGNGIGYAATPIETLYDLNPSAGARVLSARYDGATGKYILVHSFPNASGIASGFAGFVDRASNSYIKIGSGIPDKPMAAAVDSMGRIYVAATNNEGFVNKLYRWTGSAWTWQYMPAFTISDGIGGTTSVNNWQDNGTISIQELPFDANKMTLSGWTDSDTTYKKFLVSADGGATWRARTAQDNFPASQDILPHDGPGGYVGLGYARDIYSTTGRITSIGLNRWPSVLSEAWLVNFNPAPSVGHAQNIKTACFAPTVGCIFLGGRFVSTNQTQAGTEDGLYYHCAKVIGAGIARGPQFKVSSGTAYDARINKIHYSNGKVFFAGRFDQCRVNDSDSWHAISNLAVMDGSETFSGIPGGDPNAEVFDLATDGVGNVIVAGEFTVLGGQTHVGTAIFDPAPTDVYSASPVTVSENWMGVSGKWFTVADTNTPQSEFQYSLVAGTGATDNNMFSLAADGTLSLLWPQNYEAKNSLSIRIRAAEKMFPATKYVEAAITVNVSNVIEAPTDYIFTPTQSPTYENAVGVIGTISPVGGEAGDTITYSLYPPTYNVQSGTYDSENNDFTISGNQISVKNPLDYETRRVYRLKVVCASTVATWVKDFTLAVSNVVEPPTIRVSYLQGHIWENDEGTVIGYFEGIPDSGTTLQPFHPVAGSGNEGRDNDKLNIESLAIGALRAKGVNYESLSPDKELHYCLEVVDSNGGSASRSFVVTVGNLNEGPAITLTNLVPGGIGEHSSGVEVASAVGIDPEGVTNLTWYLNPTDPLFTMVGDKVIAVGPFDYETQRSHTVTVACSDGVATSSAQITIGISNENDAPTDILLSKRGIREGLESGTYIGTFSAIDAEGGAMSFGLDSIAGNAYDNAQFSIVDKALYSAAVFEYATKDKYTIAVRVNDGAKTFIKTIEINIEPADFTWESIAAIPQQAGGRVKQVHWNGSTKKLLIFTNVGVINGQPSGNAVQYDLSSRVATRIGGGITGSPEEACVTNAGGIVVVTSSLGSCATYWRWDGSSWTSNSLPAYSYRTSVGGGAWSAVLTSSQWEPGWFWIDNVTIGSERMVLQGLPGGRVVDSGWSYQTAFVSTDGGASWRSANAGDPWTSPLVMSGGDYGVIQVTRDDIPNSQIMVVNDAVPGADTLGFKRVAVDPQTASSYLGGAFLSGNGYIGMLPSPGSNSLSNLGDVLPVHSAVEAMKVVGRRLFVGGDFTSIGGVTSPNLIYYDLDKMAWKAIPGGGPNGAVLTMATSEYGDLIVGGAFTAISGTAANYLALFDPEPSQILLSNDNVFEGAAGQAVGTLTTVDSNTTAFIYSLVSGEGATDNSKFTIDSSGVVKTAQALDYENQRICYVRIRSAESHNPNRKIEQIFTIKIKDVNEGPSSPSLSGAAVLDLSPAGTVVGQLSATDPEGDPITYSLMGGSSKYFAISGSQLNMAVKVDRTKVPGYYPVIKATDSNGNSTTNSFVITITPVSQGGGGPSTAAVTVPQVAMGLGHIIFRNGSGATWVCGGNSNGELGFGNTASITTWTRNPGLDNLERLYASNHQSSGIDGSARLFVWGDNSNGQIGGGSGVAKITAPQLVLSDVFRAAMAPFHMLALTSDGTVKGAGTDSYAMYGYNADGVTWNQEVVYPGNYVDNIAYPFGSDSIPEGRFSARAIGAGGWYDEHSFIGALGGGVPPRASNNYAKSRTFYSFQNVASYAMNISAGRSSSCYSSGEDVLFTGAYLHNTVFYAPLGDGQNRIPWDNTWSDQMQAYRSVIGKTVGGQFWDFNNDADPGRKSADYGSTSTRGKYVGGSGQWRANFGVIHASFNASTGITSDYSVVLTNGQHAFAVSPSGQLFAIGSNTKGQLGLGDTTNRYEWTVVPGMSNVQSVAGTFASSIAILNDGSVWTCGDNSYGCLGGSGNAQESNWIRISAITNAIQVAADARTVAVVDGNGHLWVSGWNQEGQFGLGNSTQVNTFTQIILSPPTDLYISKLSVTEGVKSALVGTFTPQDSKTTTYTYSLVSGAGDSDNARFVISGSTLRVAAAGNLDFETATTASIRVRVTDRFGAYFEKVFTIAIEDANDPPTDLNPTFNNGGSFQESIPIGTPICTARAVDQDLLPGSGGDSYTFALVSGLGDDDNSFFTISGNQVLLGRSLNYESKTSYKFRLRGTDKGGLYFDKSFTIQCTDVMEAPRDILLSPATVAENAPAGTIVGYLTCQDDDGDYADYVLNAIIGSDGKDCAGAFEVEYGATSYVLKVKRPSDLNYEERQSFVLQVTATDRSPAARTFVKLVNLALTDVNEPPTIIAMSPPIVPETAAVGVNAALLQVADPENANQLYFNYSLISDPSGKWSVVGDNYRTVLGVTNYMYYLRPIGALDYESVKLYNVVIRVVDSRDSSYVDLPLVITIGDVNESATVLTLTGGTVAENLPAGTVVGSLSATDPEGSATFAYTLDAGSGDNQFFTISGSTIYLAQQLNYEDKINYQVVVRVVDDGGAVSLFTKNVACTNVNEAPTGVNVSQATIAEGQPAGTVIGTLSAIDPDAGDTHSYTLPPGLQDNADFSLSGTSLSSARTFDREAKGTYAIVVRVTDGGGLSCDVTKTITVSDVNEAPTSVSLVAGPVSEAVVPPSIIGDLVANDPDVGDVIAYSLVGGSGSTDNAKFAIAGGSLQLIAPLNYEASSIAQVRVRATDSQGLYVEQSFTISILDAQEPPSGLSLDNTTIQENIPVGTIVSLIHATDQDVGDILTYTLVTGVGDVDNSLFSVAGDRLLIQVRPNYEVKQTYKVRLRVTDLSGNYQEAPFTITVQDVNEAPTDIVISSTSVPESTAIGTTVATLTGSDSDFGSILSYTLASGTGSGDNGKFSIAGDRLQLVTPLDFETQPNLSVRVRCTDQGGLSVDKVFSLTVADVNEAPTNIVFSSLSTLEQQAIGTTVATLTAIDQDANESFTYSFVGQGNDNSLFSLTGNVLKTAAVFDYNIKTSASISIQVADRIGNTFIKSVVLAIVPINAPPTAITFSGVPVAENAANGFDVGSLSAVDPNQWDTITYSLPAGHPDNAYFSLQGTHIIVSRSLDYEAAPSMSVLVRATDTGGLFREQYFPITITNVNEAPTNIIVSPPAVPEAAAVGTVVGNITTIDPDAGDTHTVYLVPGTGGDDNVMFDVVKTGSVWQLKTKAVFDYEVKNSYSIRLRTVDAGSLYVEKAFTIAVSDINEAPTNITLSSSYVLENSSIGTSVGVFTITDPDQTGSYVMSLVPGAGDTDNIDFSVSGMTLKTNSVFNYEAKASYSIRVRVEDNGGQTFEKTMAISVVDVKEAPYDVQLTNTSITGNNPAGSTIGTLQTFDEDEGDTVFTYSLTPGKVNNSLFRVEAGVLKTAVVLPYDAVNVRNNQYTVRIRAMDRTGLICEKDLGITVVDPDTNQAPTNLLLSTDVIPHATTVNTTIATITATDPNPNDTHTFALVAGSGDNDNGSFIVSGGDLRNQFVPDYNVKSVYHIRLKATDDRGLSIVKTFVITIVPPVNLPPVATSGEYVVVTGGSRTIALVGADPEGRSLAYSVTQMPAHGTLSGTAPNQTYTPTGGWTGTDTMQFVVSDGVNTSNVATVTFRVVLANTQPTCSASPAAVVCIEDTPFYAIALTIGDAEVSPAALSVTASSSDVGIIAPTGISITGSDASRVLTIKPSENANGSCTMSVIVSDGLLQRLLEIPVTVLPVNDPPIMDAIEDPPIIPEDSPEQTVVVTGLGGGPANENQTVTLFVTSSDEAIVPRPTVVYDQANRRAILTYRPSPNGNGTAAISVIATDSEGASFSRAFNVRVRPVNDPPSFTMGPDVVVAEGTGGHVFPGWATAISAGPKENQTLTFTVKTDHTEFFTVQPRITTSGELSFTLAPNHSGIIQLGVVLTDDTSAGGKWIATSERFFTLKVTQVNDPPEWTKGADVTVEEDCGLVAMDGWATGITCGRNETGQAVSFRCVPTDSGLYAVAPSVSPTGTLTFTPGNNKFGIDQVRITAVDDLGAVSAEQVLIITVTDVNDAPLCTVPPVISGIGALGKKLVSSPGTWIDMEGDAVTLSFQWYRVASATSGATRTPITGAVSQSYTLVEADVGKYVLCTVTASDGKSSHSEEAVMRRTVRSRTDDIVLADTTMIRVQRSSIGFTSIKAEGIVTTGGNVHLAVDGAGITTSNGAWSASSSLKEDGNQTYQYVDADDGVVLSPMQILIETKPIPKGGG